MFACTCFAGHLIQQCWFFWTLGFHTVHSLVPSFLASDHICIHYTKNSLPLIENKIALERKFVPWLEWIFFFYRMFISGAAFSVYTTALVTLLPIQLLQLLSFFHPYWCCLDLIWFCRVSWNCSSQFDWLKQTFSCWEWNLCSWYGSVWDCIWLVW